jgi:hypothetical protein
MEAVLEIEPGLEVGLVAVEVRERLFGFVEGIVSGLPLARQRENAGLYVRGLIDRAAARVCSRRCFGWRRRRRGTSRCSSS